MNANEASMTNTLAMLGRLNIEVPRVNGRVVKEMHPAKTREDKKATANGEQDSKVFTENRVSEPTVDTLVASPYRISHYPNSRFWGVYDGDDLVAVTVYRRGAEEVRRRLQAAADLER